MYCSKYYTSEEIDQRLLQNYLDDYNSQNDTSLTKEQFHTLLRSLFENILPTYGYTYENIAMPGGDHIEIHRPSFWIYPGSMEGTLSNFGNIHVEYGEFSIIKCDESGFHWYKDLLFVIDNENPAGRTNLASFRALKALEARVAALEEIINNLNT